MQKAVINIRHVLLANLWFIIIVISQSNPSWGNATSQEYSPADYNHNIEERSIDYPHDEYEVIAQATCTSMVIARGDNGWTYAVRRVCQFNRPMLKSCNEVCTAWPGLKLEGPQTRGLKWKCSGALHVYTERPSSAPSSVTHPSMGLKVLWTPGYETSFCGPNFCCCSAVF